MTRIKPDHQRQHHDLNANEQDAVERGIRLRAPVVYAIVRQEGTEELARPAGSLVWSGIAAGIAMGFSLISEGILHSHLPPADWEPLVSSVGYSMGFVIVIMGRQQLFTENTLTAFLPVLSSETEHRVTSMLRLWVIVFLANLAGTLVVAGAIATDLFLPDAANEAYREISREVLDKGWWEVALPAVFAGWLIATIVWLLPSAGSATFLVIVVLTSLIRVLDLPHVVATSVELFLLGWEGTAGWGRIAAGYIVPSLLGNVLGGSVLFALISYGQVMREH